MFKNAWDQRAEQKQVNINAWAQELRDTKKEIDKLLERILEASNATVISAYEGKIENLERQMQNLEQKRAEKPAQKGTFSELFEPVLDFLANPWNIWVSRDYNHQRVVLRLAFEEPIAYCRDKGYRTAKTTIIFKWLEGILHAESDLVPGGGFEPPTRGFSIRCSTN